MITLKESILTNTKNKVKRAGKDIRKFFNVPTMNDFYDAPGGHLSYVDWFPHEDLFPDLNEYKAVTIEKGTNGLRFRINMKEFASKPFYYTWEIHVETTNGKRTWCMSGWYHKMESDSRPEVKQTVLDIIEKLCDPEKMKKLFDVNSETWKSYNKKDLIKDL